MTPARFHITCHVRSGRFDLTYRDSADLVLGGWVLAVTDSEGHLCRTDSLASASGPEDLYRWLATLAGPDIALKLVRLVQGALEREASKPVAV